MLMNMGWMCKDQLNDKCIALLTVLSFEMI